VREFCGEGRGRAARLLNWKQRVLMIMSTACYQVQRVSEFEVITVYLIPLRTMKFLLYSELHVDFVH
jgi:hypothetical protein